MEKSKAQAQKPEPKSQAHSKISFKKGLTSSLTPPNLDVGSMQENSLL